MRRNLLDDGVGSLPCEAGEGRSLRTPQHDKAAHGHLHRLVALIQRRRAHLEEALVRPRLRWPHLENLTFDAQLIAGSYRTRPAQFFEPRADHAAGGLEVAVDQKPHRCRCGMPTARGEAAEERSAGFLFVEMKRLRIEFGSERLDAFGIDTNTSRACVTLPDFEVFQVVDIHRVLQRQVNHQLESKCARLVASSRIDTGFFSTASGPFDSFAAAARVPRSPVMSSNGIDSRMARTSRIKARPGSLGMRPSVISASNPPGLARNASSAATLDSKPTGA